MLYIQLTQARSQVNAPVNSINNHCLKRRFLLFHTQEKNCKKKQKLKWKDAPLCSQGHPETHFASVLCSLMRFKAIVPFWITRVMIIAQIWIMWPWVDCRLHSRALTAPGKQDALHNFALLVLIVARYEACKFLLRKQMILPHLCLWQTKNNFAMWGHGSVPVSSPCISRIRKEYNLRLPWIVNDKNVSNFQTV